MANKVGKYELIRKLATGGMAEVFLARFEWARGLEKTVVVKRILYHLAEDPSFIEMFFTEAQLAAQLSHPNIAQIIEFGESEGVYFLAMEYIDGPSLRALNAAAHAEGSGMPFAHCARIAAFCCEALTHAHELTDAATGNPLNLVHRDVSPDNILVSKTGSVKLVDFGIAKAATQNHQTKTGLVKGKLAYMAPEQLRAEPLDRRADVFSLGVVLYELVAGAKPYNAPSEITLIHAMLYEDKVPLRDRRKDVPPELERIINKALERNRDERYADCRAMHADLEEYLISTRQPVSALQIAQLVEKYRLSPGKAEGTPPRALVTPNREGPPTRTPEPWRVERTPAAGATAQLRQPHLRTGTDGDQVGPAAPPQEDDPPPPRLEKTELIEAPRPPPRKDSAPAEGQARPQPVAPPPARKSKEIQKPASRSRTRVVAAAAVAVALLVVGLAFLRPSGSKKAEQPSQPEQTLAQKPVDAPKPPAPPAQPDQQKPLAQPKQETQPPEQEKGLEAKTTHVAPPGPSKPPPSSELAMAPKQAKPSPPTVELVVRSEPPGMLKVSMGGKVRANQQGPVTLHLPPGLVEIDASGSGEHSFNKRESFTLEPAPKHQEHTIVVGKGDLLIRSFPASHVTLDGAPREDTPLKVQVYEGQHTARLECDRSIPKCANTTEFKQTVNVPAGKTTEITQRWQ